MKKLETQMNAMMRHASPETMNREKSTKAAVMIFGRGVGEGFEAAFAIAVMLGALWLLVSGYI
jgi:hypothetical protein